MEKGESLVAGGGEETCAEARKGSGRAEGAGEREVCGPLTTAGEKELGMRI